MTMLATGNTAHDLLYIIANSLLVPDVSHALRGGHDCRDKGPETGCGAVMHGSVMQDRVTFLRSWLASPGRAAAIAPSGEALARLITAEISVCDAPVIELGPGTGVFTRALLERGLDARDLTLLESDPGFTSLLRSRFPGVRISEGDAARMVPLDLLSPGTAGAVVSGLGLLAMARDTVAAIVDGAFHYLRQDGALYQFTYGPRCPVPRRILEQRGLKAQWIGGTMCNLPPASVYRIDRDGT